MDEEVRWAIAALRRRWETEEHQDVHLARRSSRLPVNQRCEEQGRGQHRAEAAAARWENRVRRRRR